LSEERDRILAFVSYTSTLSGYERGEAQVFCDRLFRAFGHGGYKEAGATLEFKLKRAGKPIGFPDLFWRPWLLLEMKSRGEKLQRHYQQAFDYWLNAVPDRPKYVVLCNFDEFWVYDFNVQLHDPMDRIRIDQLADRYEALNFIFAGDKKPVFDNDRVAVTRAAADKVAQVFNSLIQRGEKREHSQRFILQCVVAMFSEDFDLLPKAFFSELLDECIRGSSSYDLLGGLFRQMNSETQARGGRYQGIRYFNGGLFEKSVPIELSQSELKDLKSAAVENWSKVAPPIFGTIFQSSMDKAKRHAFGAHFTNEVDIQSVVRPTIIRPWRERVAKASSLKELRDLTEALLTFRVLDPACGSGNFLYVAYRELVAIEMEIIAKIHDNYGIRARRAAGTASLVSTKQFFGIDRDPFAVELAKVTLMISKRVALAELQDSWFAVDGELPFEFESPLPLDNLDLNVFCGDALFTKWPEADAIIGNPPYQSKNKIQEELGPAYVNRVRTRFPEVPGLADFCVYWFRHAHDVLTEGGRAGLVGTNTIRQNYSREGGLDYIVDNGGTITEAVSSQAWSGDAAVHVSIVNWVKGSDAGMKKLFRQEGNSTESPWQVDEVPRIGAALSGRFDVTKAADLDVNKDSDSCDQGQTHGHKGFLLTPDEARHLISADSRNAEIIKPYIIGDDFLSQKPPQATRYVIDFAPLDLFESRGYLKPFQRIQTLVLADKQRKLEKEEARNAEALADDPQAKPKNHHKTFLDRWWQLSWPRQELMKKLAELPRYICCSSVTKRPVFVFVSNKINPSAAATVFLFDDDYSFGILQSGIHWIWFVERCSTLTERPRYTNTTVYDSFPWPQSPTLARVRAVAKRAVELRKLREEIMYDGNSSLRDTYRTLELPGTNPLKMAHFKLDESVRAAYGMKSKDNPLEFLFKLNQEVAEREKSMRLVTAPGLPPCVKKRKDFVTKDCIKQPKL
jgi:SAM-dependent methyltransferase